jgi:hypothetical protein
MVMNEEYSREEMEKWARETLEAYEKHPEDFLPLSAFIEELEKLGHGDGNDHTAK